jgi:hypothetical protein
MFETFVAMIEVSDRRQVKPAAHSTKNSDGPATVRVTCIVSVAGVWRWLITTFASDSSTSPAASSLQRPPTAALSWSSAWIGSCGGTSAVMTVFACTEYAPAGTVSEATLMRTFAGWPSGPALRTAS